MVRFNARFVAGVVERGAGRACVFELGVRVVGILCAEVDPVHEAEVDLDVAARLHARLFQFDMAADRRTRFFGRQSVFAVSKRFTATPAKTPVAHQRRTAA